jgi:RNA polymerase sigma-70 factor (ECF subfamily)
MQISKLAHTIPLFPKMKRTPQKFWELAGVHMKFLYNMALRYTGNRYDAEDLVQETFYIGFKKFYQLREERKFKSWLFAILRNTYLKDRRQEGKFLKSEYEDGSDYIRMLENATEHIDVERAYEQKIESEQIQELIDELPEKQKTPLLLYYVSGMSYQEISETLKVPMGTVMSRLSRGKQILKKKVLRHYLRNKEAARVVQFPRQVKIGEKIK